VVPVFTNSICGCGLFVEFVVTADSKYRVNVPDAGVVVVGVKVGTGVFVGTGVVGVGEGVFVFVNVYVGV
jgi:hypothetical protein